MVWIKKTLNELKKPTLKQQTADLLRIAKETGDAFWFSRKGVMVSLGLEPMDAVNKGWNKMEGTARTNYYKVQDVLDELIDEGKVTLITDTVDRTYAYSWV